MATRNIQPRKPEQIEPGTFRLGFMSLLAALNAVLADRRREEVAYKRTQAPTATGSSRDRLDKVEAP